MLKLTDIYKSFKEVKAVKGVSFSINKGEFVALLGPNGAGKTTLMEMIEGIQIPDEGSIVIKGMSWKHHEHELHRLMGISLQETYFIEKLTVTETLNLFGSFYGLGKNRSEEILDTINLREKQKSYVKNLSGGQRQRLALGVALLNDPELLLLDEPTTGLDPTARREIWEVLLKLRRKNDVTMILTTHYMEEADYLCERIIIVDKGVILAQGTVEELLAQNKSEEIIEFGVSEIYINQNILPLQDSLMNVSVNEQTNTIKLLVKDIISYLPAFLDAMKKNNITITTLECRKMTLDDLFLSMTGRGLND